MGQGGDEVTDKPQLETLEERIAAKPALAAKPAYISRCRKCGGMTGCCSDDREDKALAAQFARDAIRAGDILERGIAADVWGATWCNCAGTATNATQYAG